MDIILLITKTTVTMIKIKITRTVVTLRSKKVKLKSIVIYDNEKFHSKAN